MQALEQKYVALLNEAERRRLPDLDSIQLCFRALSLAATIDRDCAALLAPHGLTEGRFVLLFLLNAADDGLAPNTLASQAGVTRATITGLLDGLEREALIERHADTTDRRALTIRLTRRGKQVAKTVFDAHGRWIASLFCDLSAQERALLDGLLGKVSAGMAKRHGAPGDPA
ncbi:MarR family transcriptional regulator [Cupriavidus basilensis OR16]|uniref:MarR family transcriptional regulator n=1 Tax=Cupriavidus basilensis OR16 TaxID=1127483 RepID=H1S711_9BURK|nr:MarR family transcriptional regulator [Cupriavidus basilensis]EHP41822.1 MarR family transcriptional regulator [Cupriavidus basilensis OR16]